MWAVVGMYTLPLSSVHRGASKSLQTLCLQVQRKEKRFCIKEKQNNGITTQCRHTVLFTHTHAIPWSRRCLVTSTALLRPPGALSLCSQSAIASALDNTTALVGRAGSCKCGHSAIVRVLARGAVSVQIRRELRPDHPSPQHAAPCLARQLL